MAELRKNFYDRYKSSSIFNTDNQKQNISKNDNKTNINYNKKDSITSKISNKERYWDDMPKKEKDNIFQKKSRVEPKNTNIIINKTPTKSLRHNLSIKDFRKQKELNKSCKALFDSNSKNNRSFKRQKSLYQLRSAFTELTLDDKSTMEERKLAYFSSNIFFDKTKDKQIQKSFQKSKNKDDPKNKSINKHKLMQEYAKGLNKLNHSKYTQSTNGDQEDGDKSTITDNGKKKINFKRVNILNR